MSYKKALAFKNKDTFSMNLSWMDTASTATFSDKTPLDLHYQTYNLVKNESLSVIL